MSQTPVSPPTEESLYWRLVRCARPLRTHAWKSDLFGIAMFALAVALRWAVDGVLPPGFPFLTFFPAVILSTFFGGLRAGIACAVLSALAAWFLFIGPATQMQLTGQALLALAFFAVIAAIDIVLIHFTFAAADRLREEKDITARLYESQRTLFQEMQHRVANNIQFVAALLTLQKRRVTEDPSQAARALDEARARLDTISRIHRRLHAPELLDTPTERYLQELGGDLITAAGRGEIALSVRAPQVPLSVSQLTTLSMLVAEIVTNSLKHAFASRPAGRIHIEVIPQGTGRYVVTIADDGTGLPDGFDLRNSKGLGWRIIQGLATQLGGAVEITRGENGQGTQARLSIELG